MAKMPRDPYGDPIPALGLGTVRKVAVSAVSAASAALTTEVIRVKPTVDCYVVTGTGTPAADANSTLMSAGETEYFRVTPGEKIAVLRVSADGSLFVTEMV